MLLASLGIGLVIAVISDSERQAVQLSLLLLLASVFFSGFVLAISEFTEPVRVLAYMLPVTHGIRLMQDIMLRGGTTQTWEYAALMADRRGHPGVELVRSATSDDPCVTDRGRQAIVDEPTGAESADARRDAEGRPRTPSRTPANGSPSSNSCGRADRRPAGDPRFPRVAAMDRR